MLSDKHFQSQQKHPNAQIAIKLDITQKKLSLTVEELTILRHEGIIGRAEIDEPVPLLPLPQQDRHRVERDRDHRRPLIRHHIRIPDNPHIIVPD